MASSSLLRCPTIPTPSSFVQRTQARVWGVAVGSQRNQRSSGLICFSGVVPVLEERLIDFSLNSQEPFFRASRTVAKIVCFRFKFARSFLGCHCPCLGVVHSFLDCCVRV